jgi:hypothetical protein
MDEPTLFDRFHEALAMEPRPGAYERMRFAMINRPVALMRLPAFQMRWSKMGLRFTAAAIAAALIAIAVIGVFLVARHGPVGSVPAGGQKPPQAMPLGTQNLKAGTYAFSYPQLDAPGKPFPKAVITLPDGWSINGGFALSGPNQLDVTIWDVVDVYTNGCQWSGPVIHPGPTAAELAAVLASRPLRNATAPRAVSLGGYGGKYLEWSVPADIQFNQGLGDTGFSNCNGGYFKSWNDGAGDRYQQAPGQVDMLWILDIEGHRLLVDAWYLPGATGQDRAELLTVVNSIVFKR